LSANDCLAAANVKGGGGEKAILFFWQFVLLFVLPALVAFCHFVWAEHFGERMD
jgi:hypothetical protein